ncbi:Proline dehydrogenase, mitochondrial [Nakaseomyces bracarensis]|uniref:Proline dehydrogenase n=1 Tax=Nakaseomyces bracarensis TaxID=273131 RepID=A0ABR4NRY2_9SACH
MLRVRPISSINRAAIITSRRFVSGTQQRLVSVTPQTSNAAITLDNYENNKHHQELTPPSTVSYLKTLSKPEILSLGMIGMATLNKPILNMVIKLFPYVPMPLIKVFISKLYCGGDNFAQVKQFGEKLQKRGISNMMLSLTIEDSEGTKNIDIDYIVGETVKSVHEILKPNMVSQLERCHGDATKINEIAPGYIALKPSALVANPHEVLMNFNSTDPYWVEQRNKLVDNCSRIAQNVYDLNQQLLKKYPQRTAPFFVTTIDAEKYDLQINGVYDLQRILFKKFNKMESPMISVIGTWQLYLVDSAKHLAMDYALAAKEGYKLGLKLVRGAYIHSEAKRDSIIYKTKEGSDENYDNVMSTVINDLMQNRSNSYYGHLVVASHNYGSQMLATELLNNAPYSPGKANVVLGQLLGMSDNVTHDLITNHGAKNIIKYVPWGPPVETKDYLLRRLQENGDAVKSDNGWPLVKAVFKTLFSRA